MAASEAGTHISWFNASSAMAFLAWFGGTGLPAHTAFAPACRGQPAHSNGRRLSCWVCWFSASLVKLVSSDDAPMKSEDYRMEGSLGTISMPIRESGTGEIFSLWREFAVAPEARSDDGKAIEKGAEVVIERYEKGNRLCEEVGRVHEVTVFSDCRSTQTVRSGRKGGFMFGLPNEVVIIAGLLVLGILMIMIVIAKMYRKVGPNEALIRTAWEGRKLLRKGALIFPMVQTCRDLSLELMSFDVAPQQSLYTKQGVAVTVEAVAQIQGEERQRIYPDGCRAVSNQAAGTARSPDSPGDGRPSPGNHRPAHRGANVKEAGNGRRSHALHVCRRHERDMLVMYSFLSRTSLM